MSEVIIGGPTPLTAKIVIAEYDPQWPRQYLQEERRLRDTLGERAIRIEHTGSTSVPGLPAKPIIDMTLVVADSSDESAYLPDMEEAGYVLRVREPDWFEHRMFKGPGANINLHVFSEGCEEIERILMFRDWLRRHPEDRDVYARTKRELAARNWNFVQEYADAKTFVIQEILGRAVGSS